VGLNQYVTIATFICLISQQIIVTLVTLWQEDTHGLSTGMVAAMKPLAGQPLLLPLFSGRGVLRVIDRSCPEGEKGLSLINKENTLFKCCVVYFTLDTEDSQGSVMHRQKTMSMNWHNKTGRGIAALVLIVTALMSFLFGASGLPMPVRTRRFAT